MSTEDITDVPRKGLGSNMEWMYKGPTALVNREDYLLGRSVDKSFQMLEAAEKGNSNFSFANEIEKDLTPVSIFDTKGVSGPVDIIKKIKDDPLYQIQKKEEESLKELLKNPVRMKQLKEMTVNRGTLSKPRKAKSKKKKKHKRSKGSDSSSSSSDEEVNRVIERIKSGVQGQGSLLSALAGSSSTSKDTRMSPDNSKSGPSKGSHHKDVASQKNRSNKLSEGRNERRNRSPSNSRSGHGQQHRQYRNSDGRNYDERGGPRRRREHDRNNRSPEPGRGNRSPERGRGNRSPEPGRGNRSLERGRGNRSPERDRGNRLSDRDRSNRLSDRDRTNRPPGPDRRNRDPPKYSSSSHDSIPFKKPRSEEELEKKRQEMMNNAKWRDTQRTQNVAKYRAEAKREDESTRSHDPDFLRKQLLEATNKDVEHRVKSNSFNIQRSKGCMDQNFARK